MLDRLLPPRIWALPLPWVRENGHPHVVDHRVLHRHLQPPAFAGAVALAQRRENADRHQHAGAGVAE